MIRHGLVHRDTREAARSVAQQREGQLGAFRQSSHLADRGTAALRPRTKLAGETKQQGLKTGCLLREPTSGRGEGWGEAWLGAWEGRANGSPARPAARRAPPCSPGGRGAGGTDSRTRAAGSLRGPPETITTLLTQNKTFKIKS